MGEERTIRRLLGYMPTITLCHRTHGNVITWVVQVTYFSCVVYVARL